MPAIQLKVVMVAHTAQKLFIMQVAVTQDDDSEMTGFCPEAKVGLHAPFSCDMLVQAASTWGACSEPLSMIFHIAVHLGSNGMDQQDLVSWASTSQLRPLSQVSPKA